MATEASIMKREYNREKYLRVYADLPKEIVLEFREELSANNETAADVIRQAILHYMMKRQPDKQWFPPENRDKF